jgi:hypothetical protein
MMIEIVRRKDEDAEKQKQQQPQVGVDRARNCRVLLMRLLVSPFETLGARRTFV